MNKKADNFDNDDQQMEQLFQLIGNRPALPEEYQKNWSSSFRNELQKVIAKRRQKRTVAAGLCAALVFGLFLSYFFPWQTNQQTGIAQLSAFTGEMRLNGETVTTHQAAIAIEPGSRIETATASFARLTYQQADIRIADNTTLFLLEDKISLTSGEIYIDSQVKNDTAMLVISKGVQIRDIGTQFLVSTTADGVISRVREGAIAVKIADIEHIAAASLFARQIEIPANGPVTISDIPAFGADWEWIMNQSPEFQLEGSTALEFLEWISGESGRPLVFASQLARDSAEKTILHGDISGIHPEMAVDLVLAATQLTADISTAGEVLIGIKSTQ